ncbi:hypothetical protein RCL1_000439 [Eukaryota sp. TZLM3-RCL]
MSEKREVDEKTKTDLSQRVFDHEPTIVFHSEEHEIGPLKEKERVFVEPCMRERLDTEEFDRIVTIREPISAEEARFKRKVVDVPGKELPQGTTKRIIDDLKRSGSN